MCMMWMRHLPFEGGRLVTGQCHRNPIQLTNPCYKTIGVDLISDKVGADLLNSQK